MSRPFYLACRFWGQYFAVAQFLSFSEISVSCISILLQVPANMFIVNRYTPLILATSLYDRSQIQRSLVVWARLHFILELDLYCYLFAILADKSLPASTLFTSFSLSISAVKIIFLFLLKIFLEIFGNLTIFLKL